MQQREAEISRAEWDGLVPEDILSVVAWCAHFNDGRGGTRAEFNPAELTRARETLGLSQSALARVMAAILGEPAERVRQRLRRFELGLDKTIRSADFDAAREAIIDTIYARHIPELGA